jgi:Fur family transcriptional regulator, peroxide stress response regulator
MPLPPEEVERRMATFMAACRSAGFKVTHQRMEIFKEVAKTEEHPDAESVFGRVRSRIPSVSLDTVYRNLALLERLGVVTRVNVLCERTRFDANMAQHHHFICLECGMVKDFVSPELDGYKVPQEPASWGKVTSVHVELRAICSECSKRKKSRDTKLFA